MSRRRNIENGADTIPREIVAKLEALRARARRIMLLRGSLAVLAVALFALLAVMAVDAALVVTSSLARWLLSLSALGLAGWVAWRYLFRPLTQRISLSAMARAIEAKHPEIEERISTSVELLSGAEGSHTASRELLAKVVDLATGDVSGLLPEREITTRSARRFQWAAGAAALLMLVVFAIWPRQSGQLFVRALAPFADIGNAYSGQIRHVTGDLVVARGDAVEIAFEIGDARARTAEMMSRADGARQETVERMERMARVGASEDGAPTQRFRFRIPVADASFTYRIRSGRVLSAGYRVEVVDRPRIVALEIEYAYPEYTGLGRHVERPAAGPIEAPAGTEVTIRAALNRAVPAATLMVAGEAVAEQSAGSGVEGGEESAEAVWRFPLREGTDGFWRAELADEHGIDSSTPDQPVRAVPDRAPSVTIVDPARRDLELRPTETLPISFSAGEDYGFVSVDALVMREPGGPLEQVVEFPTRREDDAMRWEGAFALALGDMGLGKSGSLRMRLRVRDSRPAEFGGAQEAFSEEVRIRLNRDAPTLLEQVVAAQEESLRGGLQEAMRDLQEARWRAEEVARETESEARLSDQAMQRLEEIRSTAEAAARRLEELAREMAQGAFARNAENVTNAAAEPTDEAARQAGDLPLQETAQDRREMAREMAENVRNAMEGVDDAMQALQQDRPRLQELGRLDALAQEQRALAREAAAATTEGAPREGTEDSDPTDPAAQADMQAQAQTSSDPSEPGPQAESPTGMSLEERQDWQNRQNRLAEQVRQASDTFAPRIADAEQLMEQASRARELAAEAQALAEEESLVAEALAERQERVVGTLKPLTGAGSEPGGVPEALAGSQSEIANAASDLAGRAEAVSEAAMNTPAVPSAFSQSLAAGATELNRASGEASAAVESLEEAAGVAAAGDAQGEAQGEATSSADSPVLPSPLARGHEEASSAAQGFQTSAELLAAAADALGAQGRALQEQGNALGNAVEQSSGAAQSAAQSTDPASAGSPPQAMSEAAGQATAAAESLETAAAAALAAMGVPSGFPSGAPPQMASNAPGQPTPTQAGQQPGQQHGSPLPGGEGSEPSEGGPQATNPFLSVPPELARLGISAEDWARIRGTARSGVGSAGGQGVPSDYRDLAKDYFEALARESARQGGTSSDDDRQ